MQNNNFQELLDKYLTGKMTEQEWTIFSGLLNDPAYKDQLDAVIDRELHEHAFDGEPDQSTLAAVQSHLQTNIRNERTGAIQLYIKRLAVAAVFVLMAGAAWWYFSSTKPTGKEVVQEKTIHKETIIAPGGNRAILKLTDGTEIILDSAHDGMLAQQGQAKIIKLADGQLSYNSSHGARPEEIYNTVTTPKGGQYQLTLADGTKVWLNASSSLRFPAVFSGKERNVELTGEGYFEVAKTIQKTPFKVKANGVEVEVLGTHFNINSYTDETAVRTTLLEGKVRVKSEVGSQKSDNTAHTSDLRSQTSVVLKPGEQAVLAPHSLLAINHSPNVEEVIAWKNGLFQFKGADIETVLRQAARWYDVQFEYKGKITERFAGQISRTANAEQLLKILELTGKVKFEIQGKTIVVTP